MARRTTRRRAARAVPFSRVALHRARRLRRGAAEGVVPPRRRAARCACGYACIIKCEQRREGRRGRGGRAPLHLGPGRRAAATRRTAARSRARSTGCRTTHAVAGRGAPLRPPLQDRAPRRGRGGDFLDGPEPGVARGRSRARASSRRWRRCSRASASSSSASATSASTPTRSRAPSSSTGPSASGLVGGEGGEAGDVRRATARSFPRIAMTSKSPGLAVRPVSATRAGCATSLIWSPLLREPRVHAPPRCAARVHGSARATTSAKSAQDARRSPGRGTSSPRPSSTHRRIAEEEVEPVGRVDERRRALANRAARPRGRRASSRSRRRAREGTGSAPLGVLVVAREPRRLQVLVVDREKLLRVELPVAPVAVLPVERRDELVEREHLLVAVRPAEAREVVEHRRAASTPGRGTRVTLTAPWRLRELLAARREHHRQVGERRRRFAPNAS